MTINAPGLKVLILGGTREARELAQLLTGDDGTWEVISSLAGAVAKPVLPAGAVRSGGFGGSTGLAEYLTAQHIDAVVDATHPFAATITVNAAHACAQTGVPRLRLERPPYPALPGVHWTRVASLEQALDCAAQLGDHVFLSTGRRDLAPTHKYPGLHYTIRCVDPPDPELLPPRHTTILSRGPFAHDDEVSLLSTHQIDVLVSKDSGGDLTYGKFTAAAALNIPAVLIDRPTPVPGTVVSSVGKAFTWLQEVRG